MKSPRPSKTSQPRRRTRKKGIAHIVRGFVMEGLGVAALVMIFFVTVANPMDAKSTAEPTRLETQQTQQATQQTAQVLRHGTYARTWSEFSRQMSLPVETSRVLN